MADTYDIELVTGYRGKSHVTADDARSYNAGTVGKGVYVLPEGEEMAVEMIDANTLRVHSGTLLCQGCQSRIRSGEYVDVKIKNGSQSMKRNDIVVARYEKQSAEPRTESMVLKVIEGTPASGTATDPSHAEGDILDGDLVAEFPLWRVPLDGITVGTPEPLYESLVSLKALGDSVSQESAAQSGSLGNGGRWEARAGWVTVGIENTTLTVGTVRTIGTMPEGKRPSATAFGMAGYSSYAGILRVSANGVVQAYADKGGDYTGQVSYMAC